MRTLYLSLIIPVVFTLGCIKRIKEPVKPVVVVPEIVPGRPFVITGPGETELWKTDTAYIEIDVRDHEHMMSTKDTVTLSVAGAPASVQTFIERPVGVVPFGARICLVSSGLQAGAFDVTVTGTPQVGKTVAYNSKVNITTYGCAGPIHHTYTIDYLCSNGFVEKDRDILINNGMYGEDTLDLYIKPFGRCYAVLNCRNKTFTIPYQTSAGGSSIAGKGNFTPGGNMSATYLLKNAQGNASGCSAAMFFRH